MCSQWKIIDKNLTLTTIDRVFIVTNVELEAQEDNPDRDLCRYEFYEILARLAHEKYSAPKICGSIAEAIDRLMEDITDNIDHYWEWQKWREEHLWTAKIDDMYRANLAALQKIYSSYFNQIKKYMNLDDTIDLMRKVMPEINENTIKLAY